MVQLTSKHYLQNKSSRLCRVRGSSLDKCKIMPTLIRKWRRGMRSKNYRVKDSVRKILKISKKNRPRKIRKIGKSVKGKD